MNGKRYVAVTFHWSLMSWSTGIVHFLVPASPTGLPG
jgi:hypothetical protein